MPALRQVHQHPAQALPADVVQAEGAAWVGRWPRKGGKRSTFSTGPSVLRCDQRACDPEDHPFAGCHFAE